MIPLTLCFLLVALVAYWGGYRQAQRIARLDGQIKWHDIDAQTILEPHDLQEGPAKPSKIVYRAF